jgi:hypothetical protein
VIAARAQHGQTAFAVDDESVEGIAITRDLPRRQVDEGVRALGDRGEVGGLEDGAAMEAKVWMSGEAPQVLQ